MIIHEFAGTVRTIFMNGKSKLPTDSWMGWSNGRWEGESRLLTRRDSISNLVRQGGELPQ
jgi:hypothetical protein